MSKPNRIVSELEEKVEDASVLIGFLSRKMEQCSISSNLPPPGKCSDSESTAATDSKSHASNDTVASGGPHWIPDDSSTGTPHWIPDYFSDTSETSESTSEDSFDPYDIPQDNVSLGSAWNPEEDGEEEEENVRGEFPTDRDVLLELIPRFKLETLLRERSASDRQGTEFDMLEDALREKLLAKQGKYDSISDDSALAPEELEAKKEAKEGIDYTELCRPARRTKRVYGDHLYKTIPEYEEVDLNIMLNEMANGVYQDIGSQQRERTYQNCLKEDIEAVLNGEVVVESEVVMKLKRRGVEVGTRRADLLLSFLDKQKALIEMKALKGELQPRHLYQLKYYMCLLRVRHGYILNFPHEDGYPTDNVPGDLTPISGPTSLVEKLRKSPGGPPRRQGAEVELYEWTMKKEVYAKLLEPELDEPPYPPLTRGGRGPPCKNCPKRRGGWCEHHQKERTEYQAYCRAVALIAKEAVDPMCLFSGPR